MPESSEKPSFIPILKQSELPKDAEICNAVIEEAEVGLFGHYGNMITLCLTVKAQDDLFGNFMPLYCLTRNIGFILKGLFETIGGFDPEDFTPFSRLKGKPIRVACKGNRFIGIGNFLEDKWFLESSAEDWMKEREN